MAKKTVYHSNLGGPIRVAVESDVLPSKFREQRNLKENDPGYYILFVKIDGEDHTYLAENKNCADTLARYKGQEVTIEATGRGEEAQILIKGASEKTVAPIAKSETQKLSPQEVAKKAVEALMIAAEEANAFRLAYNVQFKETPMTDDHFIEVNRSIVIHMSQKGAI